MNWSCLVQDVDSWLAVVKVSTHPRSIEGGNLARLHWQPLKTQNGICCMQLDVFSLSVTISLPNFETDAVNFSISHTQPNY